MLSTPAVQAPAWSAAGVECAVLCTETENFERFRLAWKLRCFVREQQCCGPK
jgi:hypothetical protein